MRDKKIVHKREGEVMCIRKKNQRGSTVFSSYNYKKNSIKVKFSLYHLVRLIEKKKFCQAAFNDSGSEEPLLC